LMKLASRVEVWGECYETQDPSRLPREEDALLSGSAASIARFGALLAKGTSSLAGSGAKRGAQVSVEQQSSVAAAGDPKGGDKNHARTRKKKKRRY